MTQFKKLFLITFAFSAVVLAISLNSAGNALAQAVTLVKVVNKPNEPIPVASLPKSPLLVHVNNFPEVATLFSVGTGYQLQLSSGPQTCNVREIRGVWLKCRWADPLTAAGYRENWVNSLNIVTSN